VLPYAGTGLDPILVDGLVETITSQLTRLEAFQDRLWVVPASEVKGLNKLSEVRKQFGVNLVVTGRYLVVGDSISLTQTLNDAENIRVVNALGFMGSQSDLLAFQEGVFENLVQLLDLELNPEIQNALKQGGTTKPGVYEFYLRGLGYLQRYESVHNIDIAIGLFELAIKEDVDYTLAYAGLAEAYWKKYEVTEDPQWVEPAIENAERAFELNAQLAPVRVILGTIHVGTGAYEDAVDDFEEALTLEANNTEALLGLASAYDQLNKYEQAESMYRRAIASKPDYWVGYNKFGIYYFVHGRYREAEEQFERVIELTPDNHTGYINVGAANQSAGHLERAIEMYELSIEKNPNYIAYYNLGLYNLDEDRYEEAARMYREALRIQDTDYEVWGMLASAYYELPDSLQQFNAAIKRAIEGADRQLEINPNDVTALTSLARSYRFMEERDQAFQYLERAVALEPDNPFDLNAIGVIYYELGQSDEALLWFEKGLENGLSVVNLETESKLDSFRTDPRFQQLIDRFQTRPIN
jgi:tetratricopeptide (TPR) repeat protein